MPKAMIVTVGTGKTGKDIAHGICFSIDKQNPDFITFVVTSLSREKTISYILENPSLKEKECELKDVQDGNDVELIYQDCIDFIKELFKRGYKPKDIIADYTSGTKAMSSGLCLAAVSLEVATLSYVYGKRGEGGRTISGTERLIPLEPVRILADNKIKLISHLFNSYQFDACLKIIGEIKVKTEEPEIRKELDFLETLSRAYSFWDKFNLNEALEELKKLRGLDLLSKWRLKGCVERNKEVLFEEKTDRYSLLRIADLLQNGKRRAEEGKYDDAVARLYRLLEFLAQYRLHKGHGKIETADLNLKKIPQHLKNKYEKYKDKDGKIKLSLHKSHELLGDLKDAMGMKFREDKEIRKILGLRNNSILAHGFHPVNQKGYEHCLNLVLEYVSMVASNVEELERKARFPEIAL